MGAPNKEQFANNGATTLNGAINNSTTSVTVTDGSMFPSSGNFRIIVDAEIMLVTARSGNGLTVVRGAESTTAASHSNGAAATHVLTTGGFNDRVRDNDPLYNSARRAFRLVNDTGAAIVAADFTWVNQNSSVAADQSGTIAWRKPARGTGEDVTLMVRGAPSAPYSYCACIDASVLCNNSTLGLAGLAFRESGTGKIILFCVAKRGTAHPALAIYKYTNATTYSGSAILDESSVLCSNRVWLKVEDDNTDLKFYFSNDGIEWIQVESDGRTAFMAGGPNQVGWGGNLISSDVDMVVRLNHWSKT